MSIGLKHYLGAAALITSSIVLPHIANAQEVVEVEVDLIEVVPIPEVVDDEFFDVSGDYYRQRTIPDQVRSLLGLGVPATFPELAIEADAEDINELYRELLELQASSDPVLRTPDLPNPFATSLLLLPSYGANFDIVGPELVPEFRRPVIQEEDPAVRALY